MKSTDGSLEESYGKREQYEWKAVLEQRRATLTFKKI